MIVGHASTSVPATASAAIAMKRTLRNEAFAFPTAPAALHGRLLVVNSQLNAGANPTLPFTIVDLRLAGS